MAWNKEENLLALGPSFIVSSKCSEAPGGTVFAAAIAMKNKNEYTEMGDILSHLMCCDNSRCPTDLLYLLNASFVLRRGYEQEQ